MKKISFKKIGIFTVILAVPFSVMAQTTTNPTELIKQLQELLNQYSEKIRVLENENKFLKETLAKNNIQIPLDEYNKALATNTTTTVTPATGAATTTVIHPPVNTTVAANELQNGFIKQFRADWPDIRKAYTMPADARIGMYEFVKNEAGNNVFVNIVYGNGTPEGAYNAKLLYSFDKKTFKRTLIGFFLYNSETKGYRTLRGTNPFAGVERDRVMETGSVATTVTTTANTATTATSVATATTTQNNPSEATQLEQKMREAYLAKNYAQVFVLSDAFLKNNKATYLIYFHRYRAYYAQGQYQNALNEIKKMEADKIADARIYCDAYAINYVIKNTTAANNYKNLAGAGCRLTP